MGSSKSTNRVTRLHLKKFKRSVNTRSEKERNEDRREMLLNPDVDDSEVKLNRKERRMGEAIISRRKRKMEKFKSSMEKMFDDVIVELSKSDG